MIKPPFIPFAVVRVIMLVVLFIMELELGIIAWPPATTHCK
jgi:hypothetical protein